MKERPALFCAPMVRGLLDDTKLETRRVIGVEADRIYWTKNAETVPHGHFTGWVRHCDAPLLLPLKCPYGVPGDRLWVRETWRRQGSTETVSAVRYRADESEQDAQHHRWTPSIFMPRWASRITLEVTHVRAQRLQDINGEDVLAEGIRLPRCACEVCRRSWQMCPADAGAHILECAALWDSINGARPGKSHGAAKPYTWSANPWVWAITFRRLT